MKIPRLSINISFIEHLFRAMYSWMMDAPWLYLVVTPAIAFAVLATSIFWQQGHLVAYGDAESHLNIAKRVVDSLTPGMAQLGGIWLPIPHIMMVPFVYFDGLWRSGLAGSIVSGASFVVTAMYLYKLIFLLTRSKIGAMVGSWMFIINPNMLYLQSTAMSELPLIAFFTLSSYYFVRYIQSIHTMQSLIFAAFFSFMAVLTRYDGWFLVLVQIAIILYLGIIRRNDRKTIEGTVVLFASLGLLGVVLWLLWGQLILGNALYFTQSEFSAKTQQQAWLARGELPAYHNLPLAFLYYFVTAMSNSGFVLYFLGIFGLIRFLTVTEKLLERIAIAGLMLTPFVFYVVTLFVGQSVIFIPHVTPKDFEWTLFNVRYGVMMIPVVAVFIGYLFTRANRTGKYFILSMFVLQTFFYTVGISQAISYTDGVRGLSHAKRPDAEQFMKNNYDGGLVLFDDYARTISVIRSGIPMNKIIYIGTKPYWEESLQDPEAHATWIVMQKSDAIWNAIYEKEEKQNQLYAHFEKVYTSPDILIFKRRSE